MKNKKYILRPVMITMVCLLIVACNQDSNEEKPTTVSKESISEITTYDTTISQTTIVYESSAEMPSENSYTEASTSIDANEDNILCMKQGTDKLQTPFIYIRADHDLGPFYCKEQNIERVNELHSQIDGIKEVPYIEFDDLCIIGINNSTSQITPNALNEIKEIYTNLMW